MLFSEHFNITLGNEDDWFDPILETDTKLFIDPFFIYKTEIPIFKNCHSKIVNFFLEAFKIAATSEENKNNLEYRLLKSAMMFPEAKEICLGYGEDSIDGAGSGKGFSEQIVAAIYESIQLGIENINHFEQLGIFRERIGCDRISDIAANIIKKELVDYTTYICERHHMEMTRVKIEHYDFDFQFRRWTSSHVFLPLNPFKKKLPILLVPAEFLGELPTISAEDFWDYCWENKNQEIRDQFNIVLKNEAKKSSIIEIAKAHREWVQEYEKSREESNKSEPYNLQKDPQGLYHWDTVTRKFVIANPQLYLVKDRIGFIEFTESIIQKFIHFVENNSGYKLLWNDDTGKPKREEATQLLFMGIANNYCKANNIDISKEVNLGRGPVDFKFSQGYKNRALIEVKLAKNSKFWNGLNQQLPKYLEVEDIRLGYFVVVCFTEKDLRRIKNIQILVQQVCASYNIEVKVFIIDATKEKLSASNL